MSAKQTAGVDTNLPVARPCDEPTTQDKPGPCAWFLYYTLAGFAYWFGAKRFDFDGDGDFDAADVDAFLKNGIGHLRNNFFHTSVVDRAKAVNKEIKKNIKEVKQDIRDKVTLDQDGDGEVTLDEILEAKVDGDVAVEDDIKDGLIKKQRLPLFIICQTLIAFLLWSIFDIKKVVQGHNPLLDPILHLGGIDSVAEGMTDLRAFGPNCADYRTQLWRWLTYQWTHAGFSHVAMNSILNLMLGIPLEGFYGSLRMFCFYNIGVVGGALCYMIGDGHRAVVGMSGGCYALLGMHIAGLIMNWKQFKFRRFIFVFLTILVGMDIIIYFFTHSTENSSVSAHVGGAVAGFIMGIVLGRNIKVRKIEYVWQGLAFTVGLGMTVFCILWLFLNKGLSVFDEEGWCWMRLVNYEALLGQAGWHCVSCNSQECIGFWQRVEDVDILNRTASAFMDYCWDRDSATYKWIVTDSTWPEFSAKLDSMIGATR